MKIEKFKILLYNTDVSYKIMTIDQFQEKYHPTVRRETIAYAVETGRLDYIRPGRERFIVLTKKSLAYQPQPHSSRA